MRYVSLWLEHHRVGQGRRCFFVVAETAKFVTLFYVPTLTKIKITQLDFTKGKPLDEPYRKGVILRQMRGADSLTARTVRAQL